ncbi:glycoside hydrolase family 79 protein [Tulasnella calospora MUT 4182]|uniref:Glycoside hydrolase family 79 protein n=1 Tax=Tulasnella calospora MUT 4182 TaxID=1051891 RepID=A0A0C3QC96_9AGAM|nr:glycoside hydrolase family 79 protein [Tulasnella calospora MUT 4182]
MSSSESLTLTPNRLSFLGCTHERTAKRSLTIKSNETISTLLLNITTISGRRYPYLVVPNVVYIKPNEELEINITRGRIINGTAEGEWRDVLGIEAIRPIILPKPQDPEHPPPAEDLEELWARANRTGKHITSWLVPMDHDEPEVPEIVVSESEDDDPEESEPQITLREDNDPEESEPQVTWRELERPGNWFRFHSTEAFALRYVPNPNPNPKGQPASVPTNAYFSAMFWKPIEHREAQECVIRLGDDENIHHVKMAMKWIMDGDSKVPGGDGTPRSLIGRALHEFRIWRNLDHRHIAPLCGMVLWPNIGFLSPFYTNGRILKYIVDQKPSWEVRVRFMMEIASALVYLHNNGIVYGDLKEDNVLIDHNQNAILIDFGLSMTVEDAKRTPSFTGHIRYLGPEVAEVRTKSIKTDVYAYGLLILEIAIGRTAREEHGADHIAAANAYYYPTLKRSHYPELRDSDSNILWKLIAKCTARTPDKRPYMLDVTDYLPKIRPSDWVPAALP